MANGEPLNVPRRVPLLGNKCAVEGCSGNVVKEAVMLAEKDGVFLFLTTPPRCDICKTPYLGADLTTIPRVGDQEILSRKIAEHSTCGKLSVGVVARFTRFAAGVKKALLW